MLVLTCSDKEMMDPNDYSEKKSNHPAYIDETRNEAFCSAVAISHIEGDCEIEELIMFRLELDLFDQIDDSNIFLEATMLFQENES